MTCACSAASTGEEAVLVWDLHRVGSRWLVESVRLVYMLLMHLLAV